MRKSKNTESIKPDKKQPTIPGSEEQDFAKTIEGQSLEMMGEAMRDKHYLEAQVISWSLIEQVLLPRLIGWVSSTLKIKLPKDFSKQNAKSMNLIYLSISHDNELYTLLEKSRKQRNEITHRLMSLVKIKDINKLSKDCIQTNMQIHLDITYRFDGTTPIPSINLYKNGWNDCREETERRIRKIMQREGLG